MMLSKEKIGLAQGLFLAGVSNVKIVEITGISEPGLYKLINRLKWRELKDKTLQIKREEGIKDWNEVVEIGIRSTANSYLKRVQSGEYRATANDFFKAAEHKRLVDGLSTENIAVKGEISLEERYKDYMEKKKRKSSGQEDEFVKDVLPGV